MSFKNLKSTFKALIVVILLGFSVACNTSPPNQTIPEPGPAIQDLDITVGQTIYVPAYSKIYSSPRGQTLDLTVTLSIHNTDTDQPIFITSVRYYDAQGALVKEYLANPLQLSPLGTADFYVESDVAENEGLGTNFIVEWGAEQPVYEPIVEAIMIHADSTQGISFTSPGRVIHQLQSEEE
ncbi:MAG: DUF3124 domain-containing protein [Anaerolineaceae bacterium]|nr:DUF3124 domain-containing protein [Anaerolineaceae bacterium]